MKKRIRITALAVCTAVTLIGCGSIGKNEKVVEQKEKGYKLAEYVKLGEYKGIEVEKPESTKVTDEEVESELEYALSEGAESKEIKDRGVQEGDTANISCEAAMDGEEYADGSFEEYELEIGSGEMIDGFESGLIDKNIGDEVELNLTFPEDYYEETVAGKDVQFKVTVNSISLVTVPELTDDYVKANTDYKTVDEYRESVRKDLQESNDNSINEEAQNAVFGKIVENATVEGYPEELYDDFYAMIESNYQSMAEMFGVEVEELYSDYYGITEDDLKEEAIGQIQQYLVWQMIAEEEKIRLTESEYKKGIEEMVEYYSQQDSEKYSIEEFEELYGKEEVAEELLRQKVMEFLVSEAKVTEVSYEEYYGEGDAEMEDSEETTEDEELDETVIDEEAEEEMLQEEENGVEEIDESDIQEAE